MLWCNRFEEILVHALDGRQKALKGLGDFGMLPLIALGCCAVVGIGGGDIEGGEHIRLLLSGGLDNTVEQLGELTDQRLAAVSIDTQDGTDEHQGTETTTRGTVGHIDMTVVEQMVEGGALGLFDARHRGVLDTTVEDGNEFVLDMVDEMIAEQALDGTRQVEVGGLIARECQGLLAMEEGNAQGDADAMGGVLHVEDLGLGILEGAGGDDSGVVVVDVLNGRTEGEALAVLAAQGDEGLHHRIGHGDATAGTTPIEVHVQAALTVPRATDKTGHLVGAGLDEHEVVHGTAKVVGISSIATLFSDILGIGIRDGLGQELIGYEILEKATAFPLTLLILLLQVVLNMLGLEVQHHVPMLVPTDDGGLFLHIQSFFLPRQATHLRVISSFPVGYDCWQEQRLAESRDRFSKETSRSGQQRTCRSGRGQMPHEISDSFRKEETLASTSTDNWLQRYKIILIYPILVQKILVAWRAGGQRVTQKAQKAQIIL